MSPRITIANLAVLRLVAYRLDEIPQKPVRACRNERHHVQKLIAAGLLFEMPHGTLGVTTKGRSALAQFEDDQRFFGEVVRALRDQVST